MQTNILITPVIKTIREMNSHVQWKSEPPPCLCNHPRHRCIHRDLDRQIPLPTSHQDRNLRVDTLKNNEESDLSTPGHMSELL